MLFTPVIYLAIAGILMGIVNGIMSAGVKFKQAFAVICYSSMTYVVFTILAIVIMFLKSPEDFNVQNPVGFNPGAYMDPNTTSKFLHSLASSLDVFTIWTIVLVAVGLQQAAGKKLSFGGALTAVMLPWGVVILAKAGMSGMFS